jgi:hypothetical protein
MGCIWVNCDQKMYWQWKQGSSDERWIISFSSERHTVRFSKQPLDAIEYVQEFCWDTLIIVRNIGFNHLKIKIYTHWTKKFTSCLQNNILATKNSHFKLVFYVLSLKPQGFIRRWSIKIGSLVVVFVIHHPSRYV